jgi:exodeoxyribonuclease VIII
VDENSSHIGECVKNHFMIDLETMGLAPNAAIISIGVVHFNNAEILNRFYTAVSLADSLKHGLTTTQSTVDWWQKQTPEARAAWQTPDAPSLSGALKAFNDWINSISALNDVCPWGNGADFDLVLLKSSYEAIQADPPWKYYNQHCFRTIKNMFPVGAMIRRGVHHNALDDAEYQTQVLHRILNVHKITLS